MRYTVINEQNEIVNIIIYDGISVYDPGVGLRLFPVSDDTFVDVGWIWTVNGPQPPPEAAK